jgi:hypothetical protein
MRLPSTLLFVLLPLTACEPMDDPGSPWKPVPVDAPAAVEGASEGGQPEALPGPDPMFDVPEPVVIHSSELGQDPTPADEGDAVADVEPEPEPVAAEPEPEPEPIMVEAPAAMTTFQGMLQPVAGSWPLRLVATVPGAQPPRAILGLPGGSEVVVTPGTMLPEAGVVVMAIGSGTIDLAEVRPAGDHAVVQGVSLQAQRSQRIEIGAAP